MDHFPETQSVFAQVQSALDLYQSELNEELARGGHRAETLARFEWIQACIDYLRKEENVRDEEAWGMIQSLINMRPLSAPAFAGLHRLKSILETAKTHVGSIQPPPSTWERPPTEAEIERDAANQRTARAALDVTIDLCKRTIDAFELVKDRNALGLVEPMMACYQDINLFIKNKHSWTAARVFSRKMENNMRAILECLGNLEKRTVREIGHRAAKRYRIDKRTWEKRANGRTLY